MSLNSKLRQFITKGTASTSEEEMLETENDIPTEINKHDIVSWFEIPAIDFQQAVNFYNQIFDIEMEQHVTDSNAMAFFPTTTGVGGSIIASSGSIPSDTGPLLYLNGGEDLNLILNKIEPAGGRVVMPKTFISEDAGYFAIFIDSQGNKLALHSTK